MPIPKKLDSLLRDTKVAFSVISHKTVFTVYDLAQTLKRKLDSIAKTLLVKVDKRYVIIVLPANAKLDFAKVKKALKAKDVRLAKENDMAAKFNVKPGAITPFGMLHKLDVVLDKGLLKAKEGLFGAGSFTESISMKVKDFIKLVNPHVAGVGAKNNLKLQGKPAKTAKKPRAKKRR